MIRFCLTFFFFTFFSTAPFSQVPGDEYYGKASFYHRKFNNRATSAGERFHNDDFSAAHRTLPFGSLVEVTNLATQLSALVRINDRGPYSQDRLIDLSQAAAKQIGMLGAGVADVKVKILMIPMDSTRVETIFLGEKPNIQFKEYTPLRIDSSGRYRRVKIDSARVHRR